MDIHLTGIDGWLYESGAQGESGAGRHCPGSLLLGEGVGSEMQEPCEPGVLCKSWGVLLPLQVSPAI